MWSHSLPNLFYVVWYNYTVGEDFDFVSQPMISIGAGTNRGCLQISIIASSVIEPMESFTLSLNTSAVDALTGPFAETTVFILGDEGRYVCVF